MDKHDDWFFVYRTVCGKIQQVPSDFLRYHQKLDNANSLIVDQIKTSSSIEPLKVEDPYPALGDSVCVGIFLGSWMETRFLNQKHNDKFLRQILGFKTYDEMQILDPHASVMYTSGLLGHFHNICFDVVPVDPEKTAVDFGLKHRVHTTFGDSLDSERFWENSELINFQFEFGTDEKVKYCIEPKSITYRI